MAKPTRLQVLDAARAHLGADATGGSALFSDTILAPHFDAAYRQLYRVMSQVQSPYVESEAFYNLPAYTSVLQPSTAGITNLGEPLDLWDRGSVVESTVSNVTAGGTTVTVTTTGAHARVAGDQVILYGVSGISGVNGIWTVASAPTTTSLTFNGANPSGAYASGGTLTYSSDPFGDPLTKTDYIDSVDAAHGGSLGWWSWMGDVFRFQPSTEIRQLRILYATSGDPPTNNSDTIGIDDSLDALSYRTAGLAAASRGMSEYAMDLNSTALGPTFAKDGELGGLYLELLQAGVRAMQGERWRRPPFRPRRTMGGIYNY